LPPPLEYSVSSLFFTDFTKNAGSELNPSHHGTKIAKFFSILAKGYRSGPLEISYPEYAEGGIVETCFSAEQTEAEAKITRIATRLTRYLLKERGIGRRAGDRSHAQIGTCLDELRGIADAERDHRGAHRFQRHVVGDASCPQAIVQAADDAIGWTQLYATYGNKR
jgi:hypothetical protein